MANSVEKIADAIKGGGKKKPIFEKEKVTVIFVLGGPGAGGSFSPFSTIDVGLAMSLA